MNSNTNLSEHHAVSGEGYGATSRSFLIVVISTTVIFIVTSYLGVYSHFYFPGWFGRFVKEPIVNLPITLGLVVIVGLVVVHLLSRRQRYVQSIFILMITGYTMQLAFGYMENKGIEGIRANMVNRGHVEIARTACEQDDLLSVIMHYDSLQRSANVSRYVQTKPPGHLLMYMLTERAASYFFHPATQSEKLDALSYLASYTWPFISYLVLLPLFFFARIFLDDERALLACMLYVVIPSVNLITLHEDQVFFPLLFVSSLLCVAYASKRNSGLLMIGSGVLVYLSCFVSFSLLTLLPSAFACIASVSVLIHKKPSVRSIVKPVMLFVVGFLLVEEVFRNFLGYNMYLTCIRAMQIHIQWKGLPFEMWSFFYYSFGKNLWEFAVWIGVPMSILLLSNIIRSTQNILKKRASLVDSLSYTLLVIILLLGFFGKTYGEVNRLWIFLIPLCCTIAAYELSYWQFQKRYTTVYTVLACQFFIILTLKMFQLWEISAY